MERATSTPVWQDARAIALLMAATLTVMANATISPALAGLEEAFAGQPHAALLTRLLVPAPSLTVVICAPLAGLAADRIGRRWLLLGGVMLFVVTGSAGLYLPDLPSIFASRLALGVAVAMIMTSQAALIGDYFAGDQRSALMGLETSARNFGGFVFITLAGWLAVTSPRLPFAVYGLAAVYLPFIWAAIRAPRSQQRKGAPAEVVDAQGHPSWGLWILALALLQAMTNMSFFMMPTQLPFFLDSLGYDSAAMTGAALGALTLAGGCTALLYRRVQGSLAHAGTYALGYAFMATGFTLLPLGNRLWAILAGTAAIGAGYALVMPNFVAIALHLAPLRRRGLAVGTLTAAVFLGQFCSPFASIPSIERLGYDGTFHGTALLLGSMALGAAASRIHGLHRSLGRA